MPSPSPFPKKQRPVRKKKNTMSPEGRQKLSELAKQRHAEGKMGGAQFGKLGGRGNTREKREAQRSVAEAAAEHKEQIIAVFKDAIDEDAPMSQRLKGAELWLTVERENAKLGLAEEKADGEQMGRDELIAALVQRLTSEGTQQAIATHLEEGNIIDAEVVE